MTQKELEKYLWGAATQLCGTIDAGDYKQYIFPLLFFKRICDVWDEELERMLADYGEEFVDEHRFQVPEGCHWKDIRETPANVGTALQNALQEIERANPDRLFRVFGSCGLG